MSALACLVFLWLRFGVEPPGPPDARGVPAPPGTDTTCDLLLIVSLFIWSIAKFGEDDGDQPLWPYALSVLFCAYPLLVVIF